MINQNAMISAIFVYSVRSLTIKNPSQKSNGDFKLRIIGGLTNYLINFLFLYM